MKKWLLFVGLFILASPLFAKEYNWNTVLISSAASVTKNWDFDLNKEMVEGASFQVVYSSSSDLAGTPTMTLMGSNDGSNYQDLYIGTDQCTISYATPYTPSDVIWDLGLIYFKYLRFEFVAGSAGSVTVALTMNATRD